MTERTELLRKNLSNEELTEKAIRTLVLANELNAPGGGDDGRKDKKFETIREMPLALCATGKLIYGSDGFAAQTIRYKEEYPDLPFVYANFGNKTIRVGRNDTTETVMKKFGYNSAEFGNIDTKAKELNVIDLDAIIHMPLALCTTGKHVSDFAKEVVEFKNSKHQELPFVYADFHDKVIRVGRNDSVETILQKFGY